MSWEDKPANYAKVIELLAQEAIPPGSLVLLPEMFATGFTMNAPLIAEKIGGETEQFLARIAHEHSSFVLGGVVVRGQDGHARNQAIVFSPEGCEVARYSKMQPFTLGGESVNYAAGAQVVTFQCNDFLVAPFICYDLRFPELFRIAAWQRPHLYTVIASWPEARISHWVKLLTPALAAL